MKYTYHYLDLTEEGQSIEKWKLTESHQLKKKQLFFSMMKSGLSNYQKNMCKLLANVASVDEIISNFDNFEQFGNKIMAANLNPQ